MYLFMIKMTQCTCLLRVHGNEISVYWKHRKGDTKMSEHTDREEMKLDQMLKDMNMNSEKPKQDSEKESSTQGEAFGKTAPAFEKELEKAVDRRIRKVALRTVFAVLVVLALIFAGISPVMDLVYPNAVRLASSKDNENEDGPWREPSALERTLNAYYTTMRPYVAVDNVSARHEGFGNYAVELSFLNYSNPGAEINEKCELEMVRGTLEFKSGDTDAFTFVMNQLPQEDDDEYLPELIGEIEKLPDSAILYVGIREDTATSADELLSRPAFSNKEDAVGDLSVDWVRIEQPDCAFNGGIGLTRYVAYSKEDTEKLDSAQAIHDAYLENLQTLVDNPGCWGGLPVYSDGYLFEDAPETSLQECIDDLQSSEEINVRCYFISGEKEKIVNYLSTLDGAANVIKVKYSDFG